MHKKIILTCAVTGGDDTGLKYPIVPVTPQEVAQAAMLGGHVRVGIEDNLYIEKGVLARDNAALVTRARTLIELLGSHLATPAEARAMLGLVHPAAAAAAVGVMPA